MSKITMMVKLLGIGVLLLIAVLWEKDKLYDDDGNEVRL